jgi:hypothetical protein
MPYGTASNSRDMTCVTWVKRSTDWQSASVTTPMGRSPSSTTAAPCERFGSRFSRSPTGSCGPTVMGVSYTTCRPLTHEMTSVTTSMGMSCGMIAIAPRRATVSAIRRPATAVMFATTNGMVVPEPSLEARSTARREPTSERAGTMNTSSYVRSYCGRRSLRKRTWR